MDNNKLSDEECIRIIEQKRQYYLNELEKKEIEMLNNLPLDKRIFLAGLLYDDNNKMPDGIILSENTTTTQDIKNTDN